MSVSAPSHSSDYTEVQRFGQMWLWVFLAFTTLPIAAGSAALLISHFVFGATWPGMSDTEAAVASVVGIGLPLVTWTLLYFLTLITHVTSDGVKIRFFPVYSRSIAFEEIEAQEAVTYNPVYEYGGWGIRRSKKNGMAYNVSGNRGVRLKLKDGRRVLIGSADAERLSAAIREPMAG